MQVAISNNIYTQAQMYAERKGQDLSAMIERYLLLYIQRNNEAAKDEIPDVVASLLGAGKAIEDDDLNGRKAYPRTLEEKYQ